MIDHWLKRTLRNGAIYKFNIYDISCLNPLNNKIKDYLATQTLIQYNNLNYLKRYYKTETPDKLREHLQNYVFPNVRHSTSKGGKQIIRNVRQGDFGEILTTLIVEKFNNLQVPISKLRYKFNKDRSVFCTDLISHNKGESITNLRYYEVKTKTSKSVYNVGIEAYQGLEKDESKPAESIANFLSCYYHEKAETIFSIDENAAESFFKLAKQFNDIVKNPQKYNRSFEIVLIIETSYFKERLLANLNGLSMSLSPLEVTVILVDDLNDLIVTTFKKAEDIAIQHVFPPKSTTTIS